MVSILTSVKTGVNANMLARIPSSYKDSDGHSQGIYRASFEELEGDTEQFDWQLMLESLHIAFMQQEALRFELSAYPELSDNEPQAETIKTENQNKSFNEFSDAEDGREDTHDHDGDDESYEHSH